MPYCWCPNYFSTPAAQKFSEQTAANHFSTQHQSWHRETSIALEAAWTLSKRRKYPRPGPSQLPFIDVFGHRIPYPAHTFLHWPPTIILSTSIGHHHQDMVGLHYPGYLRYQASPLQMRCPHPFVHMVVQMTWDPSPRRPCPPNATSILAKARILHLLHALDLVLCLRNHTIQQRNWIPVHVGLTWASLFYRPCSTLLCTVPSFSDSFDRAWYHCPNCSTARNKCSCLLASKLPHTAELSLSRGLQESGRDPSFRCPKRIAHFMGDPPSQGQHNLGWNPCTLLHASLPALGNKRCATLMWGTSNSLAPLTPCSPPSVGAQMQQALWCQWHQLRSSSPAPSTTLDCVDSSSAAAAACTPGPKTTSCTPSSSEARYQAPATAFASGRRPIGIGHYNLKVCCST